MSGYACGIGGCDYETADDADDPASSLRYHVQGKSASDETHKQALEDDAVEAWHPELFGADDAPIQDDPPGGEAATSSSTSDEPELELEEPDGATDEEVAAAVAEAEADADDDQPELADDEVADVPEEDAGDYENLWGTDDQDDDQDDDEAALEAAGDDGGDGIPTGWLVVGTVLVVVVLVVLFAGDGDPNETVEQTSTESDGDSESEVLEAGEVEVLE